MGVSERDLLFKLRSLGANVSSPADVLQPDAIQAVLTGKSVAETAAASRATFLTACDSCGRDRLLFAERPAGGPFICRDCKRSRREAKLPRPKSKPVAREHTTVKAAPADQSSRRPNPKSSISYQLPAAPTVPSADITTPESPIDERDLFILLRKIFTQQREAAGNQVFVVHGHDLVKYQISTFITLLGLTPIMLDERANRGRTVIEKLEDHGNTSFAVILLTGDDVGGKKNSNSHSTRARQNVILELGYFLGKLGRDRVCALYVPGVELPSDLHGLLYVELDDNGGWKHSLRVELEAAGLPVKPQSHGDRSAISDGRSKERVTPRST
jgi:hypothetical protein